MVDLYLKLKIFKGVIVGCTILSFFISYILFSTLVSSIKSIWKTRIHTFFLALFTFITFIGMILSLFLN